MFVNVSAEIKLNGNICALLHTVDGVSHVHDGVLFAKAKQYSGTKSEEFI